MEALLRFDEGEWMPGLQELMEEEALSGVMASIRRLFPAVAEHQSRELARAVIRDLARAGIVLARAQETCGDDPVKPGTPS